MDVVVNVHRLHDDQVIGTNELAVLLHTTPAQIYKLSSTEPHRLPPRLKVFGRKLAWRMGACRQWLRSQDGSTQQAEPAATPTRLGRPRSA